jgi:peptide/nickel transport system permease protein
MARYVARRLVQAVFVLWAAYTVSFGVLYLLPSDPVSLMVSGGLTQNTVTQAQVDQLKHQYGFDRPLLVQYASGLGDALHGDLGTSVQTGQSVAGMIGQAAPATLQLAGAAFTLAVLLGAGTALAGAYTRRRWLRQTLESLPVFAVSLPSFWVGLVLLELFSFRWRMVPAFGSGINTLILPAVTLALPTAAAVAQVFSRSLRTALAEPYIDTAVAKGAGPARVLLRHAARNAAIPTVTLLGVWAGNMVAGSVVVETVFSRTGIGRLAETAVSTEDIPVVQGLVLFGAALFVVVNLLVDVLYPLLDPRVAAGRRGGGGGARGGMGAGGSGDAPARPEPAMATTIPAVAGDPATYRAGGER